MRPACPLARLHTDTNFGERQSNWTDAALGLEGCFQQGPTFVLDVHGWRTLRYVVTSRNVSAFSIPCGAVPLWP